MLSARHVANLRWLCAAIAIGSVLLAACGGGSSKPGATAGVDSTVHVALKEWALTPDKTSATAGQVTFSATNGGTIEHELVVIKTDLAPDALKLSGNAVDEAAAGQTKIGEIAEFAPGTTKTLTLDLQPGKYVLICNVPGHYQHGVQSAFAVTAAPAAGGGY